MAPLLLLLTAVSVGIQTDGSIPIRVGNAQIDPFDLSVTYDFVNDAIDVTAYELSITRHFADGSALVSTQGQDWFSSTGYSLVGVPVNSRICSWLPRYSPDEPGMNSHRLPSQAVANPALIDANVRVTAVIWLDGTATGSQRVIDRLFSQRRAMLSEYAFWVPRLQRASLIENPTDALGWLVQTLAKPRRGEVLPGPRESLRTAAEGGLRWARSNPEVAPVLLDTLLTVGRQQYQFLVEQSVRKRESSTGRRRDIQGDWACR
jgi:hypothetical protein